MYVQIFPKSRQYLSSFLSSSASHHRVILFLSFACSTRDHKPITMHLWTCHVTGYLGISLAVTETHEWKCRCLFSTWAFIHIGLYVLHQSVVHLASRVHLPEAPRPGVYIHRGWRHSHRHVTYARALSVRVSLACKRHPRATGQL